MIEGEKLIQRMAQRDSTSVYVHLFRIEAQLADAVNIHRRECLVNLRWKVRDRVYS